MLKARKEADVVKIFEKAGAVDPGSARGLHDLGLQRIGPTAELIRRGVLRSDAPTMYYLDQARWKRGGVQQRRLLLWGMVVLAAVYAAYLIAAMRLL